MIGVSMVWVYVLIAGIFEVLWVIALKYTSEDLRLIPALGVVIGMTGSTGFLALAIRQLPMGTAYAAWTGIGTLGTACIGILYYKEPSSIWRLQKSGL